MKYTTVIFDMDGTLLDTKSAIEKVFLETMHFLEIPINKTFCYEQTFGGDINTVIHAAFPIQYTDTSTVAVFMKELTGRYNENLWKDMVTSFNGIDQLLGQLKARSLKLAVVSNSPNDIVRKMVERFFPNIFDFVQGESAQFPKKPDPRGVQYVMATLNAAPQQTLLIGDTLVDYQTALNAGIDMLGVGWERSAVMDELVSFGKCPIVREPAKILAQLAL